MMIDAMTARTIAEGKVAVAMIAVPVPSETPPGSSRPAKPVGELVRVQSPSVSNSRDAALLSSAPPGKDAAQRLVKLNADLPDAPLRMALLLEQAGLQYSKTGQRRKGPTL